MNRRTMSDSSLRRLLAGRTSVVIHTPDRHLDICGDDSGCPMRVPQEPWLEVNGVPLEDLLAEFRLVLGELEQLREARETTRKRVLVELLNAALQEPDAPIAASLTAAEVAGCVHRIPAHIPRPRSCPTCGLGPCKAGGA